MATLNVPVTTDFSAQNQLQIDRIAWTGTAAGNLIATFQSSQFDPGEISGGVILQGSSGAQTNSLIQINMTTTGAFSASSWGFVGWGDPFDQIMIFGTSGADTIIGTAFDDQIGSSDSAPGGNGGADTLFGGAGNDRLTLTVASNISGAIYDGGPGTDDKISLLTDRTYDLTTVAITSVEELSFAQTAIAILRDTQIGIGGGRITRVNFGGGTGEGEGITVRGSAINLSNLTYGGLGLQDIRLEGRSGSANSLIGSSAGEFLVGGNLGDTFAGNGGADTMTGGGGNDTFAYTSSSAIVTGESVNGGTGTADRLFLGGGGYDLTGLAMTAVEVLAFDNLTASATLKSSQLGGTGDIATVAGGSGVNSLIVGPGGLLSGFTTSLAGIVFQSWTTGMDQIAITGGNFGDTLTGSGLDDTLDGRGGNDTLRGGNGNDTLRGGTGADSLDGGAGQDTADYTGSTSVTVRLFNGTGQGGDAQGDTLAGIENLLGSASADNLIGADTEANSLNGAAGNDFLAGLAGIDILTGGAGADTLDGGTGTEDRADYTGSTSVTVRLFNGTGEFGDAQGDVLVGIEHLTGSASGDSLIGADNQRNLLNGGAGGDFLAGLSGDDTLFGEAGNDTLDGGTGNDALVGGAGADTLDGGAGTGDRADYAGSASVTVRLFNGTGEFGDAQGDVLIGIEHLGGSTSGDSLIGADAQANRLDGGGGNDFLAGLSGDDVLSGGAGNDILDGGAGNDILDGGTLGGERDTLVFGVGAGQDSIDDFENGLDRVDLTGALVFANLTLSAIAGGVRVAIIGNTATFIDLKSFGLTVADITPGDFI